MKYILILIGFAILTLPCFASENEEVTIKSLTKKETLIFLRDWPFGCKVYEITKKEKITNVLMCGNDGGINSPSTLSIIELKGLN